MRGAYSHLSLQFWRSVTLLFLSVCHFNASTVRFRILSESPIKLNNIWSWWQFSFLFWAEWNSIWFKIERKTVITIIYDLQHFLFLIFIPGREQFFNLNISNYTFICMYIFDIHIYVILLNISLKVYNLNIWN